MSSKSHTIILQEGASDMEHRLSDGEQTSGPTNAPWISWSKRYHEHWFGISCVVDGDLKTLERATEILSAGKTVASSDSGTVFWIKKSRIFHDRPLRKQRGAFRLRGVNRNERPAGGLLVNGGSASYCANQNDA
jgi:hypothetical protein